MGYLKIVLKTAFMLMPFMVCAQSPKAKFIGSTLSGCAPLKVQFKTQSSGNALSYQYNLGNGNSSNLANPQAIYYAPGKYSVQLIVTDGNGIKDTANYVHYINVSTPPKVDFSVGQLEGCPGQNFKFTQQVLQSKSTVQSYLWDFGDGSISSAPNPSKSYQSSGKYSVSLLVTDVLGCKSKKDSTNFITIYPKPIARFTASETYACTIPANFDFTNQSSSAVNYNWDFGNGSVSQQKEPATNYTREGSFDVTLTVTNSFGCSDKEIKKGLIKVYPLSVDFTSDKEELCELEEIDFIPIVSPPNVAYTSNWSFGDGISSKEKKPQYAYKQSGNYSPTLHVKMGNCKAEISKNTLIRVLKSPDTHFNIDSIRTCKTPFLLGEELLQYKTNGFEKEWLVNGEKWGESLPIKLIQPGNYQIKLVERNGRCKTESEATKLVLIEHLDTALIGGPFKGCIPAQVHIKNASKGWSDKIKLSYWTFLGDTLYTDDFNYTIDSAGKFALKFHLITEEGCIQIIERYLSFGDTTYPVPQFVAGAYCNGEQVKFINETLPKDTHDIHDWEWRLNDQLVSNQKDFTLTLNHQPKNYNISLTTYNYGCKTTVQHPGVFTVNAPFADMVFIQDSCKSDSFILIDKSVGATAFNWLTPNGYKYNPRIEEHKSQNGVYSYQLQTYNHDTKCGDTLTKTVEVNVVSRVDFSLGTAGCAPIKVSPDNKSPIDFKFKWLVNEELQSNTANPKLSFTNAGIQLVTLIGAPVDAPFCPDSLVKSIEIKGPILKGSVNAEGTCPPFKINLNADILSGEVDSFYWIIKGGFADIAPIKLNADIEEFTINEPAAFEDKSYLIELVAVGKEGCKSIKKFKVYTEGVPNIRITKEVRKFCNGGFYLLTANQNQTNPSKELSYYWYADDKMTSDQNYWNVEYKTPGFKPFLLAVSDTGKCTVNIKDTLYVGTGSSLIKFKAKETVKNCPPFLVEFDNDTEAGIGRTVSYKWFFGDGTSSELKNPKHNYLYPGVFSVTLIATDDLGCADTLVYHDLIQLNGPKGSFTFDKKQGCVPLSVNFNATIDGPYKVQWDLGDGNGKVGMLNVSHVYDYPGSFIPVMILTDSFGCTFTSPPIDTIQVYDHPIADFKLPNVCVGELISLIDSSDLKGDKLLASKWEILNKKESKEGLNAQFLVEDKRPLDVLHTISTVNGCVDSVNHSIIPGFMQLKLDELEEFYCIGDSIKLGVKVASLPTDRKVYWEVENSKYEGDSIYLNNLNVGEAPMLVYGKNSWGCADTLKQLPKIVAVDTVQSDVLNLLNVSVLDNQTVEVNWKPSNRKDWVQYEVYGRSNLPNENLQRITQLSRQETTHYAVNELNTLDYSYCFQIREQNQCINNRKKLAWEEHCTINVEAEGEQNRIAVNWTPYKGWDSLSSYALFRAEASQPNNFELISIVNGNERSFLDTAFICESRFYYKVEGIEYQGDLQKSWSDTAGAKSIWQNNTTPNELIRASVVRDKFVELEWKKGNQNKTPETHWVVQKENPLTKGFNYFQTLDKSNLDLDDKQVEVGDHSYIYRVYSVDVCGDTSPMSNIGKTILTKVALNKKEWPTVSWSAYKGWDQEVAYYEVQRKEGPNHFTTIGIVQPEVDSLKFVDTEVDRNHRAKFCYRVVGWRNEAMGKVEIQSVSNEDCAEVVSWITVPNAFTPNGDGLNDSFNAVGIYIRQYELTIYNRWGEKIYVTHSLDKGWSGNFNGQVSENDAYVYTINAMGSDNKKYHLSGSFHLIR